LRITLLTWRILKKPRWLLQDPAVLTQKFRCLIMSDPMILLALTGRLRLLVYPHRKAGAGPIGLPEEPVVTMTTGVADRSDRMSE